MWVKLGDTDSACGEADPREHKKRMQKAVYSEKLISLVQGGSMRLHQLVEFYRDEN
jgi:hypothetical protein